MSEQPGDQHYIQSFVWSPLAWLATMPVMPPKHRAKVHRGIALLIVLFLIYWLAPRWGVSPFHVRQDGFDYDPYFASASFLQDRTVEQDVPLLTARFNLLGYWPVFTLSQYSYAHSQRLVLRDAAGKIQWQAGIDVPTVAEGKAAAPDGWIGRFKLQPASAGWAWSGGWKVDLASDQIAWGRIWLAPDGTLRLIRLEPNAAGYARLKKVGAG
ncbi:MAG: hypothetical protein ACRCU9_01210 [Iodobacter sp.]